MMRRKRYSTEQIVAALRKVDLGLPVGDLIRQLGISEQTYYRWKKTYSGLESDQVRELKQLNDENICLKLSHDGHLALYRHFCILPVNDTYRTTSRDPDQLCGVD